MLRRGGGALLLPSFSATSPFFLKLSVAILNVASMIMLLQTVSEPPVAATLKPGAAAADSRQHPGGAAAVLSMAGAMTHIYTVLFDQHRGILSNPAATRPLWQAPSAEPGGETCQNTTSTRWHQVVGKQTGMSSVHRAMGGLLFATTPMIFSIFAVVVCLSPIITIVTPPGSTHRSAVCTMMVRSAVYGVFCLYSSVIVAKHILVDGSCGHHIKGSAGTRVLVSALSLHVSMHLLHQTCACHSRILLAKGVRRFAKTNSSLVQPAMFLCMCTVHVLAVLTPAASLDIVGSVKVSPHQPALSLSLSE